MRFALLCLTLCLMLAASVLAADDPADPKTPPEKPAEKPAEKEDKTPKEKILTVGVLNGVIQSIGESNRELTLKVTTQTLEPNPGAQADYLRRQQQIMTRQQQIMGVRNPVQRQQQMAQLLRDAQGLMQAQGNLFKVKQHTQTVTLNLADDVKIRTATPPDDFDEKGNVKKYTREELKKLRGDSKLPGFEAGPEALEKDRVAVVKLIRRLPPPAGKDGQPAKEKEPAKETTSLSEKDQPANEKGKGIPGIEVSLVILGASPSR